MNSLKKSLLLGVFVILAMGFYAASLLGQTGTYEYTPLPTSVFVDKETIQGWIDNHNLTAQRAHAWALWSDLTAPSGYTVNDTPFRSGIPDIHLMMSFRSGQMPKAPRIWRMSSRPFTS